MYIATELAIDAALDLGIEPLIDKAVKANPVSHKLGRKKKNMGKPLPVGGRKTGK